MSWLQGVLDKIKQKIQKLEKAIQAQREECKEPCKTTCPIPVVSGKSGIIQSLRPNTHCFLSSVMETNTHTSWVIQGRSARTSSVVEEKTPRCT